jgi:hypothetical protein
MEDTALTWLASRMDGQTLFILTVAIAIVVQAVRAICARIPRFPADWTDWWIIGAAVGAGLGLAIVDPTTSGAIAGVVIGVLATGGFEYVSRAGGFLKRMVGGTSTTASSVLLLVGLGLSLAIGGCALPQAMLQTTNFEQAQIVSDKGLVNELFDGRRAANDRLIAAVDVGTSLSIKQREKDAAAWTAAHPDGKPKDEQDKPILFVAAWIEETLKGAEAAKAVVRARIDADERARAQILANLEDRRRLLADAGNLVVRSQRWSSETQALVSGLLEKTLASNAKGVVIPAAGAASTP